MSQVETVEEFLARGGKIDRIPRGAMAEAGWTPADYNPNSVQHKTRAVALHQARVATVAAETAARKAHEGKTRREPKPPKPARRAAPKAPKPIKPPPAPKAPNPRVVEGDRKLAQILNAIRNRCDTSERIAHYTGQEKALVSVRLQKLKASGRVLHTGGRGIGARWSVPK